MKYARLLGERYTPLYFLNALIAGSFALSSYMYLYWICKIELSSLPTFDALMSLTSFHGIMTPVFVLVFLCGFVFFCFEHVRLLLWNVKNMKAWRQTVPYKALMASKDKTVLLTIPATLAVSVILVLLTGLLFVPFAMMIKAYIFPVLFIAFAFAVWRCVLVYTNLVTARLVEKASTHALGTNLGQLLAVFALTLLALPFAIVAQNCESKGLLVLCTMAAMILLLFAVSIGALRFGPRIKSMLDESVPAETAPLFWFANGILSVMAIAYIQIDGGLASAYGQPQALSTVLTVTSLLIVCCGWLGHVGRVAMQHHGVLRPLLDGKFYSQGLYAVICPLLAIGLVYGYFLNVVLLLSDMFGAHSITHLIGYIPLVALHVWTIRLFYRLNGKLFNVARGQGPDKQLKSQQ